MLEVLSFGFMCNSNCVSIYVGDAGRYSDGGISGNCAFGQALEDGGRPEYILFGRLWKMETRIYLIWQALEDGDLNISYLAGFGRWRPEYILFGRLWKMET